ncbi:oligopeptide/dipeptide ABC transporter, ATPase subunit [Sulfobacillus acidophilus TPY]|uniref:Nickel import system ATP-binding protein NikD n=1 Tax=Sulfobacillus acidophilus (strain ATCC 700253 / DSM 10332 / NAL) TaxID=679936 RepID=G8TSA6_SULAD|nr:oligopeptide/dipeptide ABC transporter, ATPase subunit [Sulfobacillus acidophilus TPY]AEW05518.1 oligopeptide/dipeptide ABC transporter, ATPase subunit [Sulfobacillus acidophilus DSM 10332]
MTYPLELQQLRVFYRTRDGEVAALRNVSLSINAGEIVGLVGESGSGKSTLGLAVMRLLKPSAARVTGSVHVGGQDLYSLTDDALRLTRWRHIAMVFQSSMNALNPVLSVESHFRDTFLAHDPTMRKSAIQTKTAELLELVRLNPAVAHNYPHELSGGMRQRVVIALALALNPSVLILDEPTTALDVVVQRAILDQIRHIQQQRRLAVLFITHDFMLVSSLADRIAVLYAGELMEVTAEVTGDTALHHPYTKGLMRAAPRLLGTRVTIESIPGEPPDMRTLPPGCPFYDRCSQRLPRCQKTPLPPRTGETFIRCHLVDDSITVHHDIGGDPS